MGSYGDDRYGGDRGREREYRDGGGRPGDGQRGDDDRGFLDRAGDELRSWFGDDDAQHRREMDQRRWEQEQRMIGRRDNDYGRREDYGRSDQGPGTLGGGGFGTGWGNQRAESWNRDRPGERGWYGVRPEDEQGGGRHYAPGEREGWFSDSRGGERGHRQGGGTTRGPSEGRGREGHDPLYSEWRRRQIEDLDRDYDEWRREHQSRFEQEFGSWRGKRQAQRQSLGHVREHMEVVGSDGSHVGAVDKVLGERIVLTRTDPDAGGIHHSVPCAWVESVEGKVILNRTAEDAKAAWRSDEQSRAMFERDGRGAGGPRNLDRAFSGTYEEGRDGSRREGDDRTE